MSEPLIKSVTLRCSVEHAFETFTAKVDHWWPSGHRRYKASKIRLDTSEHGQLVEQAPTGETFVFADVYDCEAPNKICLEWHPGKSSTPTDVTITFEQDGDFTNVKVVHGEGKSALGAQWDDRVALFAMGWIAVMAALSHHIGSANSAGPAGNRS